MNWKDEWKKAVLIAALFLVFFWLPLNRERFTASFMEALSLAKWYAREHVLLCLLPAFFIAGGIGAFVSKGSVMKYLGARAHKVLAYGVASVSGSVLAVCSCTVLPLFAGIVQMGAGLGPATAFLYSGPAINVLAIILTARILGLELGIARAVGAVAFSVVIGLLMHVLFRKEEAEKANAQIGMPEPEVKRPLWQNATFLAALVGILVFANWGAPNDFAFRLRDGREIRAAVLEAPEDTTAEGAIYTLQVLDGPEAGKKLQVLAGDVVSRTPMASAWMTLWRNKWLVTALFAGALGAMLIFWLGVAWWRVLLAALPPTFLALILPTSGMWILIPFSAGIIGLSVVTSTDRGEAGEWFLNTWIFTKQILPLLLVGVLVAGFLLGRPGHEGFIPSKYVEMLVGDNPDRFFEITGWGGGAFGEFCRSMWPIWTNFFASIFGAFMYFATLTEVPILQGLLGAGMGKGPALALLLAGPALSLPSMLVIRSILGTRKTVVFISLVVVMATVSGLIFGALRY